MDALKGVCDLSIGVLVASHQKWFAALSVFPGWFDSLAVQEILGIAEEDAEELVFTLTSRSLLEHEVRASVFGGEIGHHYYYLHDLIREIADERFVSDLEKDRIEAQYLLHYCARLAALGRIFEDPKHSAASASALYRYDRSNFERAARRGSMFGGVLGSSLTIAFALVSARLCDLCQGITVRQEWFTAALAFATPASSRAIIGRLHNGLGLALRLAGRLKEAKGEFEKALTCFGKTNYSEEKADVFGNLGNLAMDEAKQFSRDRGPVWQTLLMEAEGQHSKALAISLELSQRPRWNKRGLAQDYGNLGVVYTAQGKLDAAFESYNMRIAIAELPELNDLRGAANGLGNMSAGYILRADENGTDRVEWLTKASMTCEQALILQQQVGNRRGIAALRGDRGLVRLRLGDVGGAIEDFDESYRLFTKLADTDSAALARHRKRQPEHLLTEPGAGSDRTT